MWNAQKQERYLAAMRFYGWDASRTVTARLPWAVALPCSDGDCNVATQRPCSWDVHLAILHGAMCHVIVAAGCFLLLPCLLVMDLY
jgi:hypothetical protein